VVLLVGCGPIAAKAPPAPAPAPQQEELVCARYGYQVLLIDDTDANTIAHQDYEKASSAKDDREAAQHFLDCARRFLNTDDTYDARVCYYDAIYAFANANALEHGGKDAMLAAAAADARNGEYIKTELAGVSDCK